MPPRLRQGIAQPKFWVLRKLPITQGYMKELELSNCIKVFQILMNKTLNRVVFAEIVTIIFL